MLRLSRSWQVIVSALSFLICLSIHLFSIYSQLGFWKFNRTGIACNPIHWFQFAGDAAVISSQEKENHILLNCFSVWCQWANMIIRVDKCSSCGIKKHLSKSIQYQPQLFVNNRLIPHIQVVFA